MTPAVHILNASSLPLAELESVAETIRQLLRIPVSVEQHRLELERAYDSSRIQYNSSVLLAQLLSTQSNPTTGFAGRELHSRPDRKLIAIVDVDLYIPVLTFVFGEAQLEGTAAIVSTHRLSNAFYGVEENRSLLLERLTKELVHELGHTFGLFHCKQFECVMRSSTYVEEIDLKKAEMCKNCSRILLEKLHDG
ncbi:MAG: archaemetzincin family Zn-dependent metalloprotease [Ignavibacteriae bacterium]|nr:archaemetzincin family Zn-dependent metalloprotease [Ignavibacteriota bacterium]